MRYNKIEDVTAPNKNFGKQSRFTPKKEGKGKEKIQWKQIIFTFWNCLKESTTQ